MPAAAPRPPLTALLSFSLHRLWWPALLLPPLVLLLLSLYARWSDFVPDKRFAENAALWVLYLALAAGAVRCLRQRNPYWYWLILLIAAFVFREHHFDNTTVGVFLIIAALLLDAWRRYPRYAGYFASRATLSLLTATLLSYLLAVGCDKGAFSFLSGSFQLQNHVEEYVELLGHVMLLTLVLCSSKAVNPLMSVRPG